jgi:hypothetical protein
MSFFSRPNLEDLQFKQISGSALTLSGTTRFVNVTGLTLRGDSGFIPVIATGGTNGEVLTYRNGKITLEVVSGAEGGGIYSGASPTSITVGGLIAGSNISNCPISTILQNILVPELPPSIGISVYNGYSGGSISANCREFGDYSVGCLSWYANKTTSPICGIYIDTVGDPYIDFNCNWTSNPAHCYPTTYAGGNIMDYTPYIIPPEFDYIVIPTGNELCTFADYGICAKNTGQISVISCTKITWMNRRYCFKSSTPYYSGNCTGTCTLMCNTITSQLCNIKTTSMSMTFNNEFFYYAYPSVMGTPSFTINGLPNNAWGNVGIGSLFTMMFKNKNNYCTSYYVARSDSRISGTYCIAIS